MLPSALLRAPVTADDVITAIRRLPDKQCTTDTANMAVQAVCSRALTIPEAPCGLRGCKNGPAPFPGRMSYKATKPGLVFVLYLSMFLLC